MQSRLGPASLAVLTVCCPPCVVCAQGAQIIGVTALAAIASALVSGVQPRSPYTPPLQPRSPAVAAACICSVACLLQCPSVLAVERPLIECTHHLQLHCGASSSRPGGSVAAWRKVCACLYTVRRVRELL